MSPVLWSSEVVQQTAAAEDSYECVCVCVCLLSCV